jgi:hypothetical protein
MSSEQYGFSAIRIGYPHCNGIFDLGMLKKHLVDLAGIDVVTACNYHIFLAIHNSKIVVFLNSGYKPPNPSSEISSAAAHPPTMAFIFPRVSGITVLMKNSAVLIWPS